MSWKQHFTDRLVETLRLVLKVCIFIDVFALSLFGVWFCIRFLWALAIWLNRVMFSSPW